MGSQNYPIGTVVSDEETPSFETVRIKLKAGKHLKPSTLIKMEVDREEKTTLIGRIRSGYESNPNKSIASVTVGDGLGIPIPSISEENSIDIYRLVEADLIEEIFDEIKNGKKMKSMRSPQNFPNAGAEVWIAHPNEVIKVLGIEQEKSEGLYLGKTVGGIETNFILKKQAIQRHFFIGGTTGSGKSYAMGVIAEELIK
ncbi:MAG: DUF87 domain-containing protein, partial [Cyanobacteria bacterium P01_E01_bin.42]